MKQAVIVGSLIAVVDGGDMDEVLWLRWGNMLVRR